MQRTDVEIQLQQIHHELGLNDEPLAMDQTFRGQGYDSLDETEFLMMAEREFGVSIDDTILSNVQTPNDVVDLIVRAVTPHTPTSPETEHQVSV